MSVDMNDPSYTLYRLWLEREGPQVNAKNHRRCRRCGEVKPIRGFQLPRHRLCTACLTRSNLLAVEHWAAAQAPAPSQPSAAQTWAAQASGHKAGKLPGLTSSYEGYKKYYRDKARHKSADKENEARKAGQTKRPPKYHHVKLCVRCHLKKHISQFGHPRWRICLACDGPPLL
jgi:ribosomal protein L37E